MTPKHKRMAFGGAGLVVILTAVVVAFKLNGKSPTSVKNRHMLIGVLVSAAFFVGVLDAQTRPPRTIKYVGVDSRKAGLIIGSSPKLVIDETAGCEFNRVRGIVVQRDGKLVVANGGNNELCLFSATGSMVRRVGRTGGGPSEYKSIASVHHVPGDSLLVYDGVFARLSILGPDGTFARSVQLAAPIKELGSVTLVTPLNDGSVLIGFSEFRRGEPRPEPVTFTQQLFRYDLNGKVLNRFGRFVASEHFIYKVPREMGGVAYYDRAFGKRFGAAATSLGFVAGDGGERVVREYSSTGEIKTIHEISGPVRRVTAGDIAAYRKDALEGLSDDRRAMVTKLVAEMPYPDAYPVFKRIMTDPLGRIWLLQHPAPAVPSESWLVLDPKTKQSSVVTLRRRFQALTATATSVCGVAKDELDVESVACFSVSR